jgi:hypothetical protein
MSGLPPIATELRTLLEVRFVPTTEVADLFDYFVGLPEPRRRAAVQFYASLASPIA